MSMESYRPDWKPVEDRNLAEQMAHASHSLRTKAAEYKNAGQLELYANAIVEAEISEDKVEMKNSVRKEMSGLGMKDIKVLKEAAEDEVEKREKEYREFRELYAESGPAEKEKRLDQLIDILRKRNRAIVRAQEFAHTWSYVHAA